MGILIRGTSPTADTREPKHMVMERPEKAKLQSPDKLSTLRKWPAFVALAGIEGRGRGAWLLSLASVLAEPEHPVCLADLTGMRSFLRDPATAVRIKRTMSDVRALTSDEEEDDSSPGLLKPELERLLAAKGRAGGRILADIGASGRGAAMLGELKGRFRVTCDLLLVVNPFNPRTADADNTRALKIFIEGFSGLPVAGIVVDPHPGRRDEARLCAEGALSALAVAQTLDLPLLYVLADEEIAEKVCALLPGELPVWPVLSLTDEDEEDGEPGWRR